MTRPLAVAPYDAFRIPRPKPEPLTAEHTQLLVVAARTFIDTTIDITRRQIELVAAMHHFGSIHAIEFAEQHLKQEVEANTVILAGVVETLNSRAEGQLFICNADKEQSRPVLGVGYDTTQQAYNAMVGMTSKGPALWPILSGDQLLYEQ